MNRFLQITPIFFLLPVLAWAQPDLTPPGPPPNALPPALPAPPPEEEEGLEALTKGPIHEAFADPATPDPEPSPVVPKAPPPDVPEQPAAYKPEGDFDWISGYWYWDDDRDDFLWVTGVWRQPPPGMRWVPGYWQEISGGWQRVKGFWVQEETQEVVYYNQPPATLEVGPSSPAPAANYFWVPGSWAYANTGFNWQAGYWTPYQQDWVYVPARWIWTPAGFVYTPGYWDYRLSNRGQIFAPVYFNRPVYAQAGWFYRPSIAIPTTNLFIHLWMQPRYGSYYFGNYFGPQYASRGFVSWSNLPSMRHGYYYDPFYSYAHVHYRQQGIDYLGRVQGWHHYYDQHPEYRPPATFHEQRQWLRTPAATAVSRDAQLVARPVAEIARQTDSPIKLTQLNEHALQAQSEHTKQIRELNNHRKNLEHEHAQVNLNHRPEGIGPRPDGINRPEGANIRPEGTNIRPEGAVPPRDQSKSGSLVDRVEKGDKRSDKADNRFEKGDKGPASPVAGPLPDATKAAPVAKLALPKVELPKTASTTTSTPITGDLAKPNERRAPPALPRADHNPRVGGPNAPQNTSVAPQNPLLDGSKSNSRSTFGAKTGEQLRPPGQPDNLRVPGRDGRGANPNTRVGSANPANPPGGNLPGGNPLGGNPPGGNPAAGRGQNPAAIRSIEAPTRSGEIPTPPSAGKTIPGGQPRDRFPQPGAPRPDATPRNVNPQTITPPIGNRDRGTPRNDQPTFERPAPKSGGSNINAPQQPQLYQPQAQPRQPQAQPRQPQPQPQPPRGPSRQEGAGPPRQPANNPPPQETNGPPNENKKKGKGRD